MTHGRYFQADVGRPDGQLPLSGPVRPLPLPLLPRPGAGHHLPRTRRGGLFPRPGVGNALDAHQRREPFIDPDALLRVLESARRANMPIDYIETSASWVEEEQQARLILQSVKDLGVDTLGLSIAPYINEYVPLDKSLLLAELCHEADLTPLLWIDEFLPDMTALPTDRTHSREEYEALFGMNYWGQLRPRYALNMVGRALITHEKDMPVVPVTRIPHMSRSCAELGGRSHYHIDCYGNYIPPGCPGLALPLEALGKELDPEEFPIYTRLSQDPRALLEYCKARGFMPKGSYYNRCHLCQDMRLFLYCREPGVYKELAPASFYEAILRETAPKGAE